MGTVLSHSYSYFLNIFLDSKNAAHFSHWRIVPFGNMQRRCKLPAAINPPAYERQYNWVHQP